MLKNGQKSCGIHIIRIFEGIKTYIHKLVSCERYQKIVNDDSYTLTSIIHI